MVAEVPGGPESQIEATAAPKPKRVLGMQPRWFVVVCVAVVTVATAIVVPMVNRKPAVDAATTRACHLLAQAQDNMDYNEYLYVQAGKPAGGAQPFLDGIKQYPTVVAQAANEALAAPADVSASFADAASSARDYKAAIDQNDSKDAGVFAWSISHTVDLCRAKGVDMLIHDPTTGKIKTS